LPTVIKIIKKYNVKSVLDVGTGNGASIPIWQNEGLRVSAMEPDEEGYFYSKQHNDADVRKLAVGDSIPPEWQCAFDAIISLEVIEHLYDPTQFLNTVNQTLKKEGIIIVSTPYHAYFKNLVLAIANKWDSHHHPTRIGGHIKFWSKQTLLSFFANEGYQHLSFQGVGRFPLLWKSMIIVFKKRNENPNDFNPYFDKK
jgi:2-polyprenyl-3-methyl-5-hydroxy-6-metoxy-1,4-benzoquinol methylase